MRGDTAHELIYNAIPFRDKRNQRFELVGS